jgi:RNA polymerase sigma factor (sigma-70 family)
MRDDSIEDAVQETLLSVVLRRSTYSTDEPLGPWLTTIAYRKWVDSVRSRTRATSVPLDETCCVGDHGDTVRSAIVVEDCLATLKRPQRDAIVYRLIDGFSVSETANMTGQSESLVKVNVHRGLRSHSRGESLISRFTPGASPVASGLGWRARLPGPQAEAFPAHWPEPSAANLHAESSPRLV